MAIRDNEQPEFEIQFYKGILEKKPDFYDALSALGDLYTRNKMYDEGLKIDRRLVEIRPRDPIVYYNLACSYSLLNNMDKSFDAIKKAIKFGYNDLDYLQQDEDLEDLRKDSRFKKFFQELKEQDKKNDKTSGSGGERAS